MYRDMYICIYIYIYTHNIYTHILIYIYIYIYIRTYTYMNYTQSTLAKGVGESSTLVHAKLVNMDLGLFLSIYVSLYMCLYIFLYKPRLPCVQYKNMCMHSMCTCKYTCTVRRRVFTWT